MPDSRIAAVRGYFDPGRLSIVRAQADGSSPEASDGSLGRAVRHGALWSGAGTVLLRFTNILVMALVARILVPEHFGVFALAATVHAFSVSVAELGVAAAIARTDLDLDRIAPTVTTIAVVTSLVVAAPMAIFADDLARLLGATGAASAIRILALGVALIGPFAVPGAILQRQFRQRTAFLATVAGSVPASVYLLVAALNGGGADALAWSRVVAQTMSGLVMVLSLSRFYWPGLQRNLVGPLLAFGIPLALSNLLSQVLLHVDNIFVGRLLGVSELGAYSIAFGVSTWSTAVLGTMLNSVVLPGLTAVVRDGGDVVAAVASAVRLVSWVAAPICAFTVAFAGPLIRSVYGPQWDASVPVLRSLAVYGLLFVVGLLIANVIVATGRTTVLFWVQVCALLALLPALPMGIRLGGLVGAGWAHVAVVAVVTFPVYLLSLRRCTGTPVMAVLRQLLSALTPSALAATVAVLVTFALPWPVARFLLGALVFAVAYLALTWRTARTMLGRRAAGLPPVASSERLGMP